MTEPAAETGPQDSTWNRVPKCQVCDREISPRLEREARGLCGPCWEAAMPDDRLLRSVR
jgi:hypothetical protein